MKALTHLFDSTGFMPHGQCFLWTPSLLWSFVLSDALITASYFSIPFALWYFVRRREDLPLKWLFVMFGAFVMACGMTHLVEIWTIWQPSYWVHASVKVVAAAMSVPTAIMLWLFMPRALAIPNRQELNQLNQELHKEIKRREHTEDELNALTRQFEERIGQRITELRLKNTFLATLLETSLDAILVVDENEQIFSYNQQFIDLWRLSPQMVNARLDAPVLQSVINQVENSEAFVARVQYLYEHRDDKSHEEVQLKDGRIIDRYSAPVTGTDGKYYGRVWYFRDITERKQAEHETRALAQRYQLLMQTSSDGIHVMDEQGNLVEANNAFCHMLGYTQEEMVGFNAADWDAKWSAEELRQIFRELIGNSNLIETVHRRKDGVLIDIEISSSGVELDGCGYIFASGRDITERKRIEREMLIAATAFEVQEGIIITDAHNVILRVNQAFSRLTGYSAEDAIGQTPALLQSGRQDAKFYQQMWKTLTRDHHWHGEIWNRRKNGEVYPEWLNITAVINAEGQVTNYIGSFSDITQHKKAEDEIKHLAFYDPLTGLPNRRLLFDRLRHTLTASARHRNHGAVLFIDLDNFKVLNDTMGHNVGDLLLIEVSNRLQTCMREGDTVARLGGDEFVVILDELSEQLSQAAAQTEAVGEKILAAISQPYSLNGYEYHNSTSIGISLFHNQNATVDELLKHADAAMYEAKRGGRNALRFYDPAMQAALEARTALEADLRKALAESQFRLYYQMQVDHADHILGAEVLIRWQHPQRGLVSPLEFIPLAEETGLIMPIGQWVLETACAQLKTWEAAPLTHDLQLAVNVSARQFHQIDFVEQVLQTLRNNALNPDRLKLELTESLVLDNIDDTIAKMQELRKVGVRFSMDDFGTGYSSLSYLTQLPLDQLKIDQSFVRNIGVNSSDTVIAQTIIGMANNLGMQVIAEGVETESQRLFLEQHGCDLCQGYLFGRPVPIEEFVARLKSS